MHLAEEAEEEVVAEVMVVSGEPARLARLRWIRRIL
jgi:hypothetical protein